MSEQLTSYSDIFEAQGIPEEDQSPENFFFYKVSHLDSNGGHAGEWYAIPRVIDIKGREGFYDLKENGTVVHQTAYVNPDVTLGDRVLIHEGVRVDHSSLGHKVEIGERARISDSEIRALSVIGPDITIDNSKIDTGTRVRGGSEEQRAAIIRSYVGAFSRVGRFAFLSYVDAGSNLEVGDKFKTYDMLEAGPNLTEDGVVYRTSIGRETVIGDGVTLGKAVKIGGNVKIGDRVVINSDSTIGDYCRLREGASVWNKVIVGRGVTLGAKTHLTSGKRVQPNRYVVLDDKGKTKIKKNRVS